MTDHMTRSEPDSTLTGAEDDPLTRQFRATLAGGSQSGEKNDDRASETILSHGS